MIAEQRAELDEIMPSQCPDCQAVWRVVATWRKPMSAVKFECGRIMIGSTDAIITLARCRKQ